VVNYILASILVGLQILDFWSTQKILSAGGRELNKLMRILMDKIGVVPALLITKIPMCVLCVLAAILLGDAIELTIAFGVVGVYYSKILYSNFKNMLFVQ